MPHPARNNGVDDAMPMVVDEGRCGLEQSRHHPCAGQGMYNSTSNKGKTAWQRRSSAFEPLLHDILVRQVIPGKEEELERELNT